MWGKRIYKTDGYRFMPNILRTQSIPWTMLIGNTSVFKEWKGASMLRLEKLCEAHKYTRAIGIPLYWIYDVFNNLRKHLVSCNLSI